ncbi:hypothetical protein Fmac_011152 [Flemingia macrophylla]|uniref:Uncharacterized protein n=1 Tax=Flemingia macrophylla TaxID=520843 RepID=A0ABD1MLX6_9FABA
MSEETRENLLTMKILGRHRRCPKAKDKFSRQLSRQQVQNVDAQLLNRRQLLLQVVQTQLKLKHGH